MLSGGANLRARNARLNPQNGKPRPTAVADLWVAVAAHLEKNNEKADYTGLSARAAFLSERAAPKSLSPRRLRWPGLQALPS
jgi:hypothetical protein